MAPIKNVAIIGASGNLGSVVLSTLLASDEFTLTAITRPTSTSTFPASVKVVRVDTTSLAELTEAFKGQDAVISIVATAAAGGQDVIIDAAIAAKVQRFIPSEFGANTRRDRDTKLGKLLAAKVANTDKLERLAKEHEWFSYTALSTPLFFDWALGVNAVFLKPALKSARIVDSGNEPFSPSTLSFVGRAVLAVLQRPEVTANKYLQVSGLEVTQNQVLALAEEIQGVKYEVSHITTEELLANADAKFAKGDHSGFVDVLEAHLYGDGAGHAIGEQGDNELLGLDKEDLKAVLTKILQ